MEKIIFTRSSIARYATRYSLTTLVLVLGLYACTTDPVATSTHNNPFLAEWTGPFGGVPAFDQMPLDQLKPALEAAMAENLAELDTIAANPAAPTFDNTIAAFDDSGRTLDRVLRYHYLLSSNLSTPDYRVIEREMAPVLSAHFTRISQNEPLFRRIQQIYTGKEFETLRADRQRLTRLIYRDFERDGAALTGDDKVRYREIRQRLAELYTRFSNNLLADEENYILYLNQDQLGGLPGTFIHAAARTAAANGVSDKYAITNTRSSMDPFLTFSNQRELREKVWRTYYNRGDNSDANDNNKVIEEILNLRHERVQLLGYENYASWQLEDRMAKTPERVFDLLYRLWTPALERVHEEVRDMQALADSEGAGITIEPWDYRYYAEKVRLRNFKLSSEVVNQYLVMDNLLQALFFVAEDVFGLHFEELASGTVPVFHPTVRVWQVTAQSTGEPVGLFYQDPYARPGKESGAWATSYRSHETFRGKVTVLSSNNLNFIAANQDRPALLSWDDAETLFHEFGHALNSLESNVAYPHLNSSVRDYVEFHSQLLEHWLLTDKVVNRFLLHYDTGEPMPANLVRRLQQARNFNQGFKTVEYLACALLDMMYHTTDPAGLDPDRFERDALASLNMPGEIVMRHRSPQFSHIFSGEGYAAGYYSYIWADVLTSDAVEAFSEAPGGFYDRELAAKLVRYQFAPHNAMDPMEAYRAFRGRDASVDALLRDRGFNARWR